MCIAGPPQRPLTTELSNSRPAAGPSSDPYWWEAARPTALRSTAVPVRADVVIVGAGFTGLRAALELARAGRHVVVIERDNPGTGASGRNAGFLGRVLKKSFTKLARKSGLEAAVRIYRELDAAYQTTMEFIQHESIDCYAVRCGRFIGATSVAHYDALAHEMEEMNRHLGFPFHMVSRSSQRSELATDLYCGAAVIPDLGSVHPALYHSGLLERALAAGVSIVSHTPVDAIQRLDRRSGFRVKTSSGDVHCRDVIVATNGYTTKTLGWFARRIIPFQGYIAATEELPVDLVDKLIPNRRVVIDTNTDIDFCRIAPDTPRVIIGGATASGMNTSEAIASRLHLIMARILPDLEKRGFSHVWTGFCGGTFDLMPHVGGSGGLWYAMGYNFAGVPMGTYLGGKVAQQVLGKQEGATVFSDGSFHTAPFYTGDPWFMPLVMRYFHWQDARIARGGAGGARQSAPD